MPYYSTQTHYYEVNDTYRHNSREIRVSGMYAPLDDRDVCKRRFHTFVRTRRQSVTGEEIEQALAADRRRDADMREASGPY